LKENNNQPKQQQTYSFFLLECLVYWHKFIFFRLFACYYLILNTFLNHFQISKGVIMRCVIQGHISLWSIFFLLVPAWKLRYIFFSLHWIEDIIAVFSFFPKRTKRKKALLIQKKQTKMFRLENWQSTFIINKDRINLVSWRGKTDLVFQSTNQEWSDEWFLIIKMRQKKLQ